MHLQQAMENGSFKQRHRVFCSIAATILALVSIQQVGHGQQFQHARVESASWHTHLVVSCVVAVVALCALPRALLHQVPSMCSLQLW